MQGISVCTNYIALYFPTCNGTHVCTMGTLWAGVDREEGGIVGTGGQGAALNDTLGDLLFAFGRLEETELLKELIKYLCTRDNIHRHSLVWSSEVFNPRSDQSYCC